MPGRKPKALLDAEQTIRDLTRSLENERQSNKELCALVDKQDRAIQSMADRNAAANAQNAGLIQGLREREADRRYLQTERRMHGETKQELRSLRTALICVTEKLNHLEQKQAAEREQPSFLPEGAGFTRWPGEFPDFDRTASLTAEARAAVQRDMQDV